MGASTRDTETILEPPWCSGRSPSVSSRSAKIPLQDPTFGVLVRCPRGVHIIYPVPDVVVLVWHSPCLPGEQGPAIGEHRLLLDPRNASVAAWAAQQAGSCQQAGAANSQAKPELWFARDRLHREHTRPDHHFAGR